MLAAVVLACPAMGHPSPLDPNHQVRWAIEHLPSPAATADPIALVTAPSLGGGPDVVVEFKRAAREHRGVVVDGWLYEGPVSIETTDASVEAGFPGVESWVRGKLGPYCLHIEIVRAADQMAEIRAFATTRDALDAATEGQG